MQIVALQQRTQFRKATLLCIGYVSASFCTQNCGYGFDDRWNPEPSTSQSGLPATPLAILVILCSVIAALCDNRTRGLSLMEFLSTPSRFLAYVVLLWTVVPYIPILYGLSVNG